MKEYQVLIKVKEKWCRANAQYHRQRKPFETLGEAKAFLAEYKEFTTRQVEDGDNFYKGATFKIVSRDVSEWKDVKEA